MSLNTLDLLVQEFGHVSCFKGQNRSQLKQTSMSEQTNWQISDLDSEEIEAMIKLSQLIWLSRLSIAV
jgi:hypothetical protein